MRASFDSNAFPMSISMYSGCFSFSFLFFDIVFDLLFAFSV
jgi:hypothetical protein